jgi:hypothetical protein
MIPKSGCRFPAWAKPVQPLALALDASAGEGRSEKIMLKQQAKANADSTKNHFALASSTIALWIWR